MNNELRILHLEDNPVDAELVRETLKAEGIECEIARVETRADFIKRLEELAPDLILTDQKLPAFDGLSALEIVKERRPDVPVIFVTGSMGEEWAVESLKKGATDYVLKDKLYRLAPAIGRALKEVEERTELMKAEKALEHLNRQNELILRTAGEGIFGLDSEGRITFVNPAATAIAGYDVEELIGQNHHEIMHSKKPDGTPFPKGECPLYAVYTSGVSGQGEEIFWHKSGKSFPIDYIIMPTWEEGKAVGSVVSFRDITERKHAMEALRQSEKRYKRLVESVTNYIYTVKINNGRAESTKHGPGCVAVTGYRSEEYDSDPCLWYRMVYEEDRIAVMEQANKILSGESVSFLEHRIIHKNGAINWVRNTMVPRYDNEARLTAYDGLIDDITEQKKLEDQLRHAQKMEAVGTLAGGIAHDFNNILNVIMGYGGMVYDRLEVGSSSKEQMNEVLTAAERAANLTKRLLVFSRKQVVEVKPVNINELILDLQKMLARIVKENIDFKLDLSDARLVVMADAGQIEQVLMNLASNAKDAMPEGGRLTIGIGIKEFDDEYVAAYGYGKTGTYALITVADTGHGMDAETQKNIFEPFFTTKGIGEGTGLGLAISYGIIKQHSGYIKVYSEPGKGTTFKIYLPLIEESATLEKKIEAAIPAKGGNETILVAEDDAALRKLTSTVLEAYGYTVILAEDGEDAITKFMENREKIALVVLDMIMPKKNGKEAYEAMREVGPGIKTLFMSGYTMDIIKTSELTEAGFDFIPKPVLPSDLLKKVREILDR